MVKTKPSWKVYDMHHRVMGIYKAPTYRAAINKAAKSVKSCWGAKRVK